MDSKLEVAFKIDYLNDEEQDFLIQTLSSEFTFYDIYHSLSEEDNILHITLLLDTADKSKIYNKVYAFAKIFELEILDISLEKFKRSQNRKTKTISLNNGQKEKYEIKKLEKKLRVTADKKEDQAKKLGYKPKILKYEKLYNEAMFLSASALSNDEVQVTISRTEALQFNTYRIIPLFRSKMKLKELKDNMETLNNTFDIINNLISQHHVNIKSREGQGYVPGFTEHHVTLYAQTSFINSHLNLNCQNTKKYFKKSGIHYFKDIEKKLESFQKEILKHEKEYQEKIDKKTQLKNKVLTENIVAETILDDIAKENQDRIKQDQLYQLIESENINTEDIINFIESRK